MKYLVLLVFFVASACFADTVNCSTKEEPIEARLVTQNFSATTNIVGEEAIISGVSKADPQISFDAGGDTRDIWVSVKDARTGIAAQNISSDVSGVSATLNLPHIGEFSIYCSATK